MVRALGVRDEGTTRQQTHTTEKERERNKIGDKMTSYEERKSGSLCIDIRSLSVVYKVQDTKNMRHDVFNCIKCDRK